MEMTLVAVGPALPLKPNAAMLHRWEEQAKVSLTVGLVGWAVIAFPILIASLVYLLGTEPSRLHQFTGTFLAMFLSFFCASLGLFLGFVGIVLGVNTHSVSDARYGAAAVIGNGLLLNASRLELAGLLYLVFLRG